METQEGECRSHACTIRRSYTDVCSAAIYGLRNKADISIFILHPKGRVSPIQEAQMTTVTDYNVHNVAEKGTFDDCQVCFVLVLVFALLTASVIRTL